MSNDILGLLRRMEWSLVSNATLKSMDTKRVDLPGQQNCRCYQELGGGQFRLNGGDDRLLGGD